ncbi:hypothetical protein E1B28_008604 [Marasmius oreades]|uniref:Blue (type 1) copper domain-containing protein n=1 Tax=Marasmius oreades TaxID=181124 RepID=A0A9P7USA5_9AGAR|nr:uncharacterized protein E1B28_008604 [Marasmius oreades]KAG7092238.1 hypothetical protein E1B28_008604 [Marasmius oreades]
MMNLHAIMIGLAAWERNHQNSCHSFVRGQKAPAALQISPMSLFKSILHLTLLPAVVLAQGYGGGGGGSGTTTSSPSAPSAPADTPGQMNVDVFYQGNYVFHPPNLNASNGTLVTFYIPGGALPHSVTQSSFNAPCTYLQANTTASTPAGFDSGLTNSKQFTINITDDTKPIWFHCKSPLHCGMGMVGSINAPSTGNTHDMFVAKAKSIGNNEVTEADTGAVTGGFNAVATAGPSASSNGSTKVMASVGVSLYFVILVLSLL